MWGALLVCGVLCLITFYAKGGLTLETMTATEMGLTIGGGVLFAASVLTLPATRRRYGSWTLGTMLALTALTALSIAWSVAPDASWRDASRMLAYSAVLAGSIAAVRMFAVRWAAVLGGITLAATVVCAYGLATKVFPSGHTRQRSRAPAGTVRLLERARPDRGDGRDRLHVAGRPPARTRAAERDGLSRLRRAAAGAAARLLARGAGRARRRGRAVAGDRAAAPARRRRAAGGDARRGGGGGLGLLTARPQRRKHPPRTARGRRPRARRAGAGDGARAGAPWGWR